MEKQIYCTDCEAKILLIRHHCEDFGVNTDFHELAILVSNPSHLASSVSHSVKYLLVLHFDVVDR